MLGTFKNKKERKTYYLRLNAIHRLYNFLKVFLQSYNSKGNKVPDSDVNVYANVNDDNTY